MPDAPASSNVPRWYAALDDWMLGTALSDHDSEKLIDEAMALLVANGLPVVRFNLSFGTLDPLFESGTLLWRPGSGTERQRFRRDNQRQPEWLRSPLKRVIEGPERWLSWTLPAPPPVAQRHPLLTDLVELGARIYAVEALPFGRAASAFRPPYDGMVISWAGSQPAPFEAEGFLWLKRLNRRFAGVARAISRENRALAIARTYLGSLVGQRIFRGQIARGDVEELEGVLWYSDLRGSTKLADEMAPRDFMRLLNDYFDCTAAAVEEAGGAVLKFIGDAVLAGFPQPLPEAIERSLAAADAAAAACRATNERRRAAGEPEIVYGLALRCGRVLFGNVGTPQRLDFTVIGSAVNEVARMEALTKEVGSTIVVDATVAAASSDRWRTLGDVALRGIEQPLALYAAKPT